MRGLVSGGVEFRHTSMASLANWLTPNMPALHPLTDRPVIDKTGLTSFFDFTLLWTPDGVAPLPEVNAPSLPTALEQQLGLRFVPTKIAVDALVVDYAEKPVN